MKKYRVRISGLVSGFPSEGAQRLRVMPGEYDAYWLMVSRDQYSIQQQALRLLGADSRGGDLDVMQLDYHVELMNFPVLDADGKFQILGEQG